MRAGLVFLVLGYSGLALAADISTLEAGKKAEQQSCTPCHSLRLIHSQRLSAAAWQKEINKMIGWGAVVPEQQTLLDYLSQEYSDSKPVPRPPISVTAEKQAGR